MHKPYGHLSLQYNAQAIEPLGEAKSNWDVMRLLAEGMGFHESWLHADAHAVIREILDATVETTPRLSGLTLEQLEAEGTFQYTLTEEERIPFVGGLFPTPSGKIEMYSAQAAAKGYDPVPDWVPEVETRLPRERRREESQEREQTALEPLPLLCPGAHHFISSTFANVETLKTKEHAPTLRMHPLDAQVRNIRSGQRVRIFNDRGECQLIAEVTEDVRPGMLATVSVWWPKHSPDQHNVNWTTSDRLADFDGGSTFYTNLVSVEAIASE